ncbi:glyoxalase [Yersinia entomophaga]|uniref:Bleomycin resistance protein n=1 Tax=Yersinia entomophaga TaxID=935293 RepID=A0ABM6BRY0_YERET|nr:VOC family protein [Yersinia entomophaga]ANI31819.1 glyoxalase [Yersinia entomophaga]OWF85951.1 bleomycin resistance family protein [Yersinia entomophaga]
MENWATLAPEIVVRDIKKSIYFWCEIIGFSIRYDRPEQGFIYLVREGAQIMLEQYQGDDDHWLTAPFGKTLGNGVTFQIEVTEVAPILTRLQQVNCPVFQPCADVWYRANEIEIAQRQCLVQDADGYLLRLAQNIGKRAIID